ncbi:MAG: peptidylprolyl isomerase [Verrucomicrobiota bacterium]|nr:peptidylprolyl isomerase [Verrucomicrobiota bacterium]
MSRFAIRLIALLAGGVAGNFAASWPVVHRWAGALFHRGELVALVHGTGVFQSDIENARAAAEYRGAEDGDVARLVIAQAVLRERVKIAPNVDREFAAMRGEFAEKFESALANDGLTDGSLRRMLADTTSEADAAENAIAHDLSVSDAEVADFYHAHANEFLAPLRLHVRHIFFAAPTGYPAEVFAAKRAALADAQKRLARGEDFEKVAAAVSEDDASKSKGGDLGWITHERIPPEFFDAVTKLQPGPAPVILQSHLGFQLVQVTEIAPAKIRSLAEAAPEIRAQLAAAKRRTSVAALAARLAKEARIFVR